MFLNSRGIILRTVKYSESSLILDMYTEENGRKSFIISGIRSKNAKTKAGLLQVMGLVEFVSYDKESSSLSRIKEIKADHLFHLLPFVAMRSCLGMFMMEVCAKSIKESETNKNLFNFLRSRLLLLDDKKMQKLSVFHITFLIDLSSHLGFGIQDNYSTQNRYFSLRDGSFAIMDYGHIYSLDEKTSTALSDILKFHPEKIPKTHRNIILEKLLQYYKYHIENFGNVKSLHVLRSVFT